MRPNICWFCGRVCECEKAFPNGRPRKRSECTDYIQMPPDPPRITHKDMAEILGCSVSKIDQIVVMPNGAHILVKALARKGIAATYERVGKRIYFYMEAIRNEQR